MRITYALLLCIACLSGVEAQGQPLSITSTGVTYSQDFNTLAVSGGGNAQSGGIFSAGWSFVEGGTNGNSTYTAGTGTSPTNETYSFGSTASTERAFGMFQGSALSSILGFKFTNNTGTTITSITIGFTGEQWKQNTSADNLLFSYQTRNVSLNTATCWATVAALQFTTPVFGGSGALDGNQPANRTVIAPVTITGLAIANGETVTMRWTDATQGSSSGMGIDDFTISVAADALTPPANDDCSNAVSLTASTNPTAVTGSFVYATTTTGLTTDAGQKDVWYAFTVPCTGPDSIVVNFPAIQCADVDFEVFASPCPTSGTGLYTSVSTSAGIETKKSDYTGGTVYYIRVIDNGQVSAGTFTIRVFSVPPVQPNAISGSTTPCFGAVENYAVSPAVAGVTYTWTLPGADWVGSTTGSAITATAGSTAGNITVTPKTGCGLVGPSRSLAVLPITSPRNVTGASTSAGNGQLTVAWTNPANCYDEIMVVATDNTGGVRIVPTGDGSLYSDTTEYASANKNNGVNMPAGEYCLYKGNSTAAIITGLSNGTQYYIKIFVRWGTQWSAGVQVSNTPTSISNGDYKSVKSGSWTDNTTWYKLSGGVYVPTLIGDYPNDYRYNVSIESGTKVQLTQSSLLVRNLTVKTGAQLWTADQDATGTRNKYLNILGDITCNGTIGNTNTNIIDNISFNIEGKAVNINGTGAFSCTRIRKSFDASTDSVSNTTRLNINMDINLYGSSFTGTALYNNAQKGSNTNFYVTLNAGHTITLKNNLGVVNVCVDGTNGVNGNSYSGGKFTINGTLIIPGILFLTTDNTASGLACSIEIGSTGKVYTSAVKADASGAATHSLIIKSGGLLKITDPAGIANFSQINNIINLASNSTIEYGASGNQYVLSGVSYGNLAISGGGVKTIDNADSYVTVNGDLNIDGGNSFSLGAKTLTLNGTVSGNGSITGAATSKLLIGPGTTPDNKPLKTPLGVLRFTAGGERLNELVMNRYMETSVYKQNNLSVNYWAAVLGSDVSVDVLTLNQGIIATDKYLLTLLSYPANTYATLNHSSYVATTDIQGTPMHVGNSFNGSYGFRINGVQASADTYFPVGADFISPNRAMVNLGTGAATRNMTIVLTKGDIGYTGAPRVNRMWYMHSSVQDSVNATMRLYYTGYDLATYPYITKQDELETGFSGTTVRLLEKVNVSDHYFTNISNNADIMFNGSPNTEVYAKYTRSSVVYNGTKPGIYRFGVFSIVDSGNVVLPVTFTAVRAYRRKSSIDINWTVANETGIDHYEVERADDGRLFGLIAIQLAHNSGSAGWSYAAVDEQPLGSTNYYRIKAVGKDGEVLYSMVVNATLSRNSKAGLLVYPNPVKTKQCTIQFTNLAVGTYHVSVYNTVGQLVASKQLDHAGGSNSLKLYLPASTVAGIYIVRVTGKEVRMETRVFVR